MTAPPLTPPLTPEQLEGLLERATKRFPAGQAISVWNDDRMRARFEIVDALPAVIARIRALEEAATNSWFQLRHLQMFPENTRDESTQKLIDILAALTLRSTDNE